MDPCTMNVVTIIIGIVTIIVNILIAIYNVGKNRKIYEIETINTVDPPKEINNKLENGDYTILYVGPVYDRNSRTYVLGKLNSKKNSG